MADLIYKDLTVDNVFDFCDVLAAVGIEQVIGEFDRKELAALQSTDRNMKDIGVVVAVKVCGILIKNVSKARDEVCNFFANCMEWDNGSRVTVEEVRNLKIGQFMKIIRDFAKKDDLADFFGEAAGLLGTGRSDSRNSATGDTATLTAI